jgi:hypothetical protein
MPIDKLVRKSGGVVTWPAEQIAEKLSRRTLDRLHPLISLPPMEARRAQMVQTSQTKSLLEKLQV